MRFLNAEQTSAVAGSGWFTSAMRSMLDDPLIRMYQTSGPPAYSDLVDSQGHGYNTTGA